MSRLFVLFLCFAPLSAFADSQTSEGSGMWDSLKNEIDELARSIKIVNDPEKELRMKRLLQQKTRKLRNTRYLDLGMSKADFHKLNQLQREMDFKRHIMRNMKHSKDPRARITDEQRQEIHDLVEQIEKLKSSVIRTKSQAGAQNHVRNAIMRIREKIMSTNDVITRKKLQKQLHELMEHQKRRPSLHGGPPRIEVTPERLAQIRALREKISNTEDGAEKTAMRKELKALYDHSVKKKKVLPKETAPDSVTRHLSVEKQKRIAILRKQMAHANSMEEKLNYRNHIKAIYDSVQY